MMIIPFAAGSEDQANAVARSVAAAAIKLTDDFPTLKPHQEHLSIALAFISPARFAVSYKNGRRLARDRRHGMPLRKMTKRADISPGVLTGYDGETIPGAGVIEVVDRYGPLAACCALMEAEAEGDYLSVFHLPTRVEPIDPQLVLPFVVFSVTDLFNGLIGSDSSKADIKTKKGKARFHHGSAAHMAFEAMMALDWQNPPEEFAAAFSMKQAMHFGSRSK